MGTLFSTPVNEDGTTTPGLNQLPQSVREELAHDFDSISKVTAFTVTELEEYYTVWIEQYPSGTMSRADFVVENVATVGGPPELWHHVFTVIIAQLSTAAAQRQEELRRQREAFAAMAAVGTNEECPNMPVGDYSPAPDLRGDEEAAIEMDKLSPRGMGTGKRRPVVPRRAPPPRNSEPFEGNDGDSRRGKKPAAPESRPGIQKQSSVSMEPLEEGDANSGEDTPTAARRKSRETSDTRNFRQGLDAGDGTFGGPHAGHAFRDSKAFSSVAPAPHHSDPSPEKHPHKGSPSLQRRRSSGTFQEIRVDLGATETVAMDQMNALARHAAAAARGRSPGGHADGHHSGNVGPSDSTASTAAGLGEKRRLSVVSCVSVDADDSHASHPRRRSISPTGHHDAGKHRTKQTMEAASSSGGLSRAVSGTFSDGASGAAARSATATLADVTAVRMGARYGPRPDEKIAAGGSSATTVPPTAASLETTTTNLQLRSGSAQPLIQETSLATAGASTSAGATSNGVNLSGPYVAGDATETTDIEEITFFDAMARIDRARFAPSEKKLKDAFELFDVDGDGLLSIEDVQTALEWFFSLPSVQQLNAAQSMKNADRDAGRRAEQLVELFDRDGDGLLSRDEFTESCLLDPSILAMASSVRV